MFKIFVCVAPGCRFVPNPERAYVPELSLVERDLRRSARAQDLLGYVHCERCALRLRKQAEKVGEDLKFFPYQASAERIERRIAERVANQSHLGRFLRRTGGQTQPTRRETRPAEKPKAAPVTIVRPITAYVGGEETVPLPPTRLVVVRR